MWEALMSGGKIAQASFGHLVRLLTLTLGGLGTVYIFHRQLSIKMSMAARHKLALVSMLVYSGFVTYVYFEAPLKRMLWETFIYWVIANVFYVIFGWTLFSRMDDFLDKRFGKDSEPEEDD